MTMPSIHTMRYVLVDPGPLQQTLGSGAILLVSAGAATDDLVKRTELTTATKAAERRIQSSPKCCPLSNPQILDILCINKSTSQYNLLHPDYD